MSFEKSNDVLSMLQHKFSAMSIDDCRKNVDQWFHKIRDEHRLLFLVNEVIENPKETINIRSNTKYDHAGNVKLLYNECAINLIFVLIIHKKCTSEKGVFLRSAIAISKNGAYLYMYVRFLYRNAFRHDFIVRLRRCLVTSLIDHENKYDLLIDNSNWSWMKATYAQFCDFIEKNDHKRYFAYHSVKLQNVSDSKKDISFIFDATSNESESKHFPFEFCNLIEIAYTVLTRETTAFKSSYPDDRICTVYVPTHRNSTGDYYNLSFNVVLSDASRKRKTYMIKYTLRINKKLISAVNAKSSNVVLDFSQ